METVYKKHIPTILPLGVSTKRYTLTIHDLPNEDKPREKLTKLGPKALTTSELLATVLTVGTKKEDVVSMSARIMKEYGERSIMSATNPETLAQDLEIPLVKAMQIIACAELGRRFYQKNDASAPTIRTANDIFEYVKDMRGLTKEHLRGIYLNSHYKVIHDEVISMGTVDSNIIHPREVFRPALEYAAVAVILVHNHPSGSITPSEADIETTKQLVTAGKLIGIELVDHVIVTRDSFASIAVEYS